MHITDIIKKPVINTEKARTLLENNEYVPAQAPCHNKRKDYQL